MHISPPRRLMQKIYPHPLVSLMVCVTWLMLQHSFTLGDILIALFIGCLVPKIMQAFIVQTPGIYWPAALKLFFVVIWDVILSNIRVAKLVLGPPHQLHPKWFRVPLDSTHEQVNTLLAMIITTTPGTVSAGIDQQRGDILVHSLNSENEQLDILEIKQRYEQPLIRIFHANSTQILEETQP